MTKLPKTIDYDRISTRVGNHEIDRRTLIRFVTAAAATVGVLGSPFVQKAHAATPLRFDNWGGTFQKWWSDTAYKPFSKASGVPVVEGSFVSEEELLVNIQSSPPGSYNVFSNLDQKYYLNFTRLGLGAEIDEKKIPNLSYVHPIFLALFRRISNGALSAMPTSYGKEEMGYNTKLVDGEEVKRVGPKLLLDPRFKGKSGGWNNWQRRISFAAMQSGQDNNNIHDMDLIWKTIREGKANALKFYSSGAEQEQLFASGDYVIADAWASRVLNLKRQGRPFEIFLAKEFSVFVANQFIVKGSPMDEVHEYLNFILTPQINRVLITGGGFNSTLDPGKYELAAGAKDIPGFTESADLPGMKLLDPIYWSDHTEEWEKKYAAILNG